MLTMNEIRKRSSFVRRVNHSLPQAHASETRDNTLVLDDSIALAQQPEAVADLAGVRIENWPQFFVLWQIIGCISAYDAFLAMKYREELYYEEQNLLGRLLLLLNDGDPALFLGIKFVGTTMVLGILANIYHRRPQWGLAIAEGVAAFQIGLLAYLTIV